MALAIVPAIHTVGIILVFDMLLLPALSAWKDGQNGAIGWAWLVAIAAAIVGIMLAEYLDLPPSSSVVLALFFFAVPVFVWNNSLHTYKTGQTPTP